MVTMLKYWAIFATQQLKVPQSGWLAIATQWVQEKGWQWWNTPADQIGYNVGNVTNGGAPHFIVYPTMESGVMGYVYALTETKDANGNLVYQNVLVALHSGVPSTILTALSQSPWCDPAYDLPTLMSVMDEVIKNYQGVPIVDHSTEITTLEKQIVELEKQIAELETQLATVKKELETYQAEQSNVNKNYVTVTDIPPHNTLWGIANDPSVFDNGNEWVQLLKLNPGVIPSLLKVGQQIRVR